MARNAGLSVVALLALAVTALELPEHTAANFPGRNGVIAFVDTSGPSIKTISPHGGGMRTLVTGDEIPTPNGPAFSLESPSYSASGRQLVFTAAWGESTGPYQYHVFRIGADGSGLRQLTSTRNGQDTEPSFSPNGSQIVFSRDIQKPGAGSDDLYLMTSDGTGLRQLTKTEHNREVSASFAPNGRFIVFQSLRGIETIRPDGSKRRVMIRNGDGHYNFAPDIDPCGCRIAFIRTGSGGRELYLARIDGSGLRQVTHSGRGRFHCRRTGCPGPPVFSPDGLRIAYPNLKTSADSTLRKVGTSGRPRSRPIDTGGLNAYLPAWQPLH